MYAYINNLKSRSGGDENQRKHGFMAIFGDITPKKGPKREKISLKIKKN
jgi:hypothetical protein